MPEDERGEPEKAVSAISDEELAARVDEGYAFAELESRFLPLINSLVRRYKRLSSIEYEDLRQEALMALHRAASTYDERTGISFKTYASVCISNGLKNELRRAKSGKNRILDESLPLDEITELERAYTPTPEQVIENNESFQAVLNQIHISLSEFEKKILALYLSGYRRSEISFFLGITTKAFDNALQRVRRKLKGR